MDRTLKAELTNMCLVKDKDGRVLLQMRTKHDWPGWTLPGGHVEKGENLVQSVIREVKEETGLSISNPVLKGLMEFKTLKGQDMYIVFLYETDEFVGELKDSIEGHLIFEKRENIKEEQWAMDMDSIWQIYDNDSLTDIIFYKDENGEWKRKIVWFNFLIIANRFCSVFKDLASLTTKELMDVVK